jgi:hypothetical protein
MEDRLGDYITRTKILVEGKLPPKEEIIAMLSFVVPVEALWLPQSDWLSPLLEPKYIVFL